MKHSHAFVMLFCVSLLFSQGKTLLPAAGLKNDVHTNIENTTVNGPWTDAAPIEQIQLDWLRQDHGMDTSGCFASNSANTVERTLCEKVLAELTGIGCDLQPLQQQMAELIATDVPGNDPRWSALYYEAAELRRNQRLKSVADKYPNLVYTKHYSLGGSHYAYTENPTDAQRSERQGGNSQWRMGASLCQLEVTPDGQVKSKTLLHDPDGMIRDPDVSYDGKRVVFSMRDSSHEDDFHLYELRIDDGQLRQLTFGPGFADIEPIYLPTGDILFNSTRCMQIVDCWWTEVSNLYTCDSDGRFLRRVGFDQVHSNYPQVLDDGRVIYTRWDYNDRGQLYPQPLFVMNYDGTAQTEYYGNNSWFPTTIMHARGIPGTQKLLAIASGHHSHQRGKLITIDRSKGTQENSGVQLISPVRETRADKVDAYGQNGDQFQYPYPIDEKNYIVTYSPDCGGNRSYKNPFGVYYMDEDGHRELLAWDSTIACNQSVPLCERKIPALRPSTIDHSKNTGEYYVQDIYYGPGLEGVERGTVKELRVVAIEFRRAGVGSNRNGGPAGGALVSTPVSCDNGTWDVKRVLGTVPVEEDGSAYFEVPAKTPVYFQMIDENGNVVQSMRSWSTLQPGELFSCIGCHEDKNDISVGASMHKPTLAMRKGAQKLKDFYGPARGFSYTKELQPIWDNHCIGCHTGTEGKLADGRDIPFSLMGNLSKEGAGGNRAWSESYLNLTQKGRPNEVVNWMNVQSIPPMIPPYFAGASKSRLLSQFELDGHNGVKLSTKERDLIACWIDLLVPYCGDYWEANSWNDNGKDEYGYYEMKRNRMALIERNNIMALLDHESGDPAPDSWKTFIAGGPKAKEAYFNEKREERQTLPIVGHQPGRDNPENVYRNMALNPGDVQGDAASYPHASSNSEYGDMAAFAACNVINGKTSNVGHGSNFPSWGPHKRTDLWIQIDFGRTVEIDKLVVWLRAHFPHDDHWKSATVEFSDGSSLPIEFEKTADGQTFTFEKRRVNWLRITDLTEEMPLGWCGLSEIQAWGTDR